jgi:hypothetical protein
LVCLLGYWVRWFFASKAERSKARPTWGGFASIQVGLTECVLSDIAENAVSFPINLLDTLTRMTAGISQPLETPGEFRIQPSEYRNR